MLGNDGTIIAVVSAMFAGTAILLQIIASRRQIRSQVWIRIFDQANCVNEFMDVNKIPGPADPASEIITFIERAEEKSLKLNNALYHQMNLMLLVFINRHFLSVKEVQKFRSWFKGVAKWAKRFRELDEPRRILFENGDFYPDGLLDWFKKDGLFDFTHGDP